MTRRGHGEGSIYKDGEGRWRAVVDLGWEAGRRKRKYLSGKTRREVQEKLTAALRSHQQGISINTDERQTVGTFLERWLKDVVSTTVRPKTITTYASLVHYHLIPELGAVRLTALSPQQIQAMLTRKVQAGLAPRTVQHMRAVLRSALSAAMRWELIARNPAEQSTGPRIERTEVQPLSPEQARDMLTAVQGDRLEALYVVALATGLRQGELLGLRWIDVDPEHCSLRVSVTLQRVNGAYELREPKTSRSRRAMVLPIVAAEALMEHRQRQIEESKFLDAGWENEFGLVFTTADGAPLNGNVVTHRFQDLLERAGLPRQRFHDLRHGFATLMLAQGVQGRTIMGSLGHSQISLTMDTYGHLTPSMEADAAGKMDAILRGQDLFSPRLAADLAASLETGEDGEKKE